MPAPELGSIATASDGQSPHLKTMLLSLVNSALTLALFATFFWALDTLNQLRREQAELRGKIDRIVERLPGFHCEQVEQ